MAILTGTINNVFHCTTPLGPLLNASDLELRSCYITFSISGAYVQGDDAQLTGVPARIAALVRDGKTPSTLIDVSMVVPGDENGALIGVKTLAISTTTITFELTGSDLSTEHSTATLAAMNRDICLVVTYTCS